MATDVLVPKLGMTMTEGTVAEWLVPDGGEVGVGDPVYRLETEKIEFQVEAEAAGVVRHLVPEGTVLPPGSVVACIVGPGEPLPGDRSPLAASGGSREARPAAKVASVRALAGDTSGDRVATSPAARRLASELGIELAGLSGTGAGGRVTEADVLAARDARPARAGTPPSAPSAGDVLASPIARRLAAQRGIDLATVRGTGPGGRVTQEDVEAVAAQAGASPGTPSTERGTPVIPLRGMRKVIAERMHASLQSMAQLSMSMEVRVDEVVKLREQLIREWTPNGVRPTYTDLVIRAVAKALPDHPYLNAEISERGIEPLAAVNIGLAVALDHGLVVPVIRDANHLGLKDLAVETNRLAETARAGKLGPDDYAGGTFSVTSLGMADIDFFTPIINPPNVAILGVGRIRDGVSWEDDRPRRMQQLTLSLTIDHRAVDGVPGAAFLRAVRDLLEQPYRLLV